MRIIAGEARGLQLATPKGKDVRPTLDRVRESVFSIIAPYIDEDCRFLDLFAGTGANGIEALSRGAADAVFVDSSTKAIRLIEENLERARCRERGKVLRRSLPKDVSAIARAFGSFQLIYADPPYGFAEYRELLEAICTENILSLEGLLIVEHHKNASVELPDSNLELVQQRQYGNTALSFYKLETVQ